MGKSKVNLKSILGKAEKASAKKIKENKDRFVTAKGINKATEAANEFIETLKGVISANPNITQNIGDILSDLSIDGVKTNGTNTFTVGISFSDPYRDSLYPARYGGVHIPKLINNGVDHHMNQLHGYWHDKFIGTRTDFDSTHFMDDAIKKFMSTKAGKYDVKRIIPHGFNQTTLWKEVNRCLI